jgi:hypothetical protein
MPFDRYRVSVVVPTLNEAKNLPLVFPFLPMNIVDEVILVDGRSTDDTISVALELLPSVKIVREPALGKGAALRAGYHAATGDIIVVLDADGSNDPREIPRFLRSLVEGADFVKGSRFAHHGGTTDMPRYRQWGNGVFVRLVNLLFRSTFTDLCYGYHAFWRYCLDVIDVTNVEGFEIDTALYVRALQERLRIVEVPSFEGYRFYGYGKLQTIPDGWRVLTTIVGEWLASVGAARRRTDHLGFRGSQPLPQLSAPDGSQLELALPAPTTRPADSPMALLGLQSMSQPLQLELKLLLAISHALALQINLRDVLQQVLQTTLKGTGASAGSILVLNDRAEVIEGCLVKGGVSSPLPFTGHSEVVEHGLAGWVVRHRQGVVVTSTRDDPRWLRRAWEESEGRAQSAMGVPLMIGGRIVGVLTLVRPEPRPFTEADLALVSALATPG